MSRCRDCKYAIMDYCEYYGGVKQYFVADCEKGMPGEAKCEEFEEFKESEDKI